MSRDHLKAETRAKRIMERAMPYHLPTPPAPDEAARFIAKHGRGTPATVDFLCRNNLRLIPYCLKRLLQGAAIMPPLCEASDLVQEGFLALRRAAALYDPARGALFSTYAVCCIQNCMRTAIRNAAKNNQRQIALNEQNEAVLCSTTLRDTNFRFDKEINARQQQQIVAAAIKASLTKREQLIIMKRFGLNGEPQTLQMIAEQQALTKEGVRLIQKRAIKKLQRYFAKSYAHPEHMID